ncbi:MAG: SpoIIE family protein phosphatase [Elainellaceae cyanobacterium]
MSKILVIDDDPIIRLFLKKALQKEGYEIAIASDGQEGLEQIKKIHPDLIICDWMMPIVDGLEVCRQVKGDPTFSTIFFILLTARGSLEDRVKGLDTGADDFLAKPIEIAELQARVRAGLRLRQLTRDLQYQKQCLESELSEAVDYVRSLLPKPLKGLVQVDARFIPSSQLGGDCFDYYWLDPDYLVIYLLDVSGHGLGATLLSTAVLNLLRSQSLPDVNFYQPHHVLKALNDTFQMTNQNEKYFTIWYGVYNRARRQLMYASAGHPPAILVSTLTHEAPSGKRMIERLKTPGLPIGMLPDASFQSKRHDVPSNSSLYVFSDGTFEASQLKGGTWGLDDFVTLLSDEPITTSLDVILEQVQEKSEVDSFDDDLSLLRINFG